MGGFLVLAGILCAIFGYVIITNYIDSKAQQKR